MFLITSDVSTRYSLIRAATLKCKRVVCWGCGEERVIWWGVRGGKGILVGCERREGYFGGVLGEERVFW